MAPYGTLLVLYSYQRLLVAAESNHFGIDKVEASNGRDSYWDPCFGKYWNDMKPHAWGWDVAGYGSLNGMESGNGHLS